MENEEEYESIDIDLSEQVEQWVNDDSNWTMGSFDKELENPNLFYFWAGEDDKFFITKKPIEGEKCLKWILMDFSLMLE